MLGTARYFSATAADADDAYQRAVEKLLTRRPNDRCGDNLIAWLHTVTRNEALMIRRTHSRESSVPFDELATEWPAAESSPDDRVVELESVRRGREVLKRINPDQARCLLLRAEGLSYEEITEETGFNYAKVHRSLAEGRRVSRGLAGRIEAGAECRRLEPLISRLADGELQPGERDDVELHLENCVACQAVLRDFASTPREIASFFPVGVAAGGGFIAQFAERWSDITAWINERLANHLPATPAAEMAFGKKVALATALAGTIVAGGAGVEHISTHNSTNGAAHGAATVRQAVDELPSAPEPESPRRAEEPDRQPSPEAAATTQSSSVTEADLTTATPPGEADSSPKRSNPAEVTRPHPAEDTEPLVEAPAGGDGVPLAENDPEWP